MKFFSLSALCLLVGVSIICANPQDKDGGAKITKNEAEHIALKQHPGARVTAAKLETVQKVKVWSIEITEGEERQTVLVNAMSGRIVPPPADHR
jgi:uncharacterized membrane protein YkoI